MNIKSISRDLWLLANFRNGWEMVRYLRNPQPLKQAILLNGKTIVHPDSKVGLVESLLELWYEKVYFPHGFYLPKSGDLIVDIGANIGLFSLQAARINPHCKIAAFEPFPENFSCLSINKNNFCLDNLAVHQYAISSNYRQDLILEAGSRSLDHKLLKQSNEISNSSNYLPVEVIPLEGVFDIVKSETISLLKVDIEGTEQEIFESISESILKRIYSLIIEYHDNLRPGTLTLITEKLKSTHNLQTIHSTVSGCGLLFGICKV